MKVLILFIMIMQAAWAVPEVVLPNLDHLYVPEGFDNNDSVEVIITGSFPNPCFSRNKTEVVVNNYIINILVTALEHGKKLESGACPQMKVPFKEVVSVGNLKSGKYMIVVNRSAGVNSLREMLYVQEATSSLIDDHIYAAIEWVEQTTSGKFILHGIRYSPCFEIDQIKVLSNKRDTLSILPVMKQKSDFCPMKGVPFKTSVEIDFSGLKTSRPLLHVRTLDGRSVNTIVNLRNR